MKKHRTVTEIALSRKLKMRFSLCTVKAFVLLTSLFVVSPSAQSESTKGLFMPTLTSLEILSEHDNSLQASMASADVIIVGELHDQLALHQFQLRLLQALPEPKKWVVGVEWFAHSAQKDLNTFSSKEIALFELLQKTDYVNRWGFDVRLLQPVLEWVQQNEVPFVGLNAPKSITRKVSKEGLSALSEQERSTFPNPLLPMSGKYKKFSLAFFDESKLSAERIERMLVIQSIWDQTMAQGIQQHLAAHPGQKMIVFTGMVHATKGQGIEDALRQLAPNVSILNVGGGEFADMPDDGFDYFALLTESNLPEKNLLGVSVEEVGGRVEVVETTAGSVAEWAGVEIGHQLLAIGEYKIKTYADLVVALWLLPVQTPLTLSWSDNGDETDYPLFFEKEIQFK